MAKLVAAAWSALLLSGAALAQPDLDAATRQVEAAERAFAQTMADRDVAAFASHLSEQAVFFNGPQVLNGKAAVATAWTRFFEKKDAPFSWAPDHVVVLADGTLAHSTGPVRDRSGKPIARFNSVWRLEAPGVWRVVFDKGQSWEEPEKP
ncbi:MAG: nuclear transport factor 2 family protein [Pseudomonadota bacterium]